MEEHDRWLDWLKGFAIFLVVLGHASPLPQVEGAGDTIYTLLYKIIYFFHMPLMFMIAGWLSVRALEKVNRQAYIRDRFKRLMVPYFVFGFLYLPFKVVLSKLAYQPFHLTDTWKMLLGINPSVVLWFLWVLFFSQAILSLIVTKRNINVVLVGSFLIWGIIKYSGLHFYNVFTIGQYFFFLVFGLWLRLKIGHISLTRDFRLFFCEWFVVMGKYTMDIYMFHSPVIVVVRTITWRYLHLNFWSCVLLDLVLGIVVPLLVTKYIIRRSRILTGLILGE